jgi:DNA-binding GntR family transcriptional regulator
VTKGIVMSQPNVGGRIGIEDAYKVETLQSTNAYMRLRNEILHGELMPGHRLRASDLRERYDLGLTPIREALMRLTAEGLVEVEDHRGARVADISAARFADLMGTRRAIERLCMCQAIERGDESWEAEIITALHLLSRTPLASSLTDIPKISAWEARHRRFHYALVAACGSEWLLRFWNSLSDHSERYRKVRLVHYREETPVGRDEAALQREINDNHARIADAALARDTGLATALMDEHLTQTEQAVARLLAC